MSVYDDVLGTSPPGPTEGQKDPKYSHWCNPGPGRMGEASADSRAFAEGRAGVQGAENPYALVTEHERGDQGAKARPEGRPFESEPFDVGQFDKKE